MTDLQQILGFTNIEEVTTESFNFKGSNNEEIQELERNIGSLVDKVAMGTLTDSNALYKHEEEISNIKALILKLYGLNVTLRGTDEKNAFVLMIPNTKVTTVHDTMGIFDVIKNVGNKVKISGKIDLDTSKKLTKDDFLNYFVKAFAQKEKEILAGKVTVDRDKSYVTGMSDIPYYVFIDLPFFVSKMNCNTREITAMILHEIGHIMTNLEAFTLQSDTNYGIADTLLDDLNNLNKNRFKLKYGKGEFASIVERMNTYDKSYKDSLNRLYNSEKAADSFVVANGYGEHLTSLLTKLGGKPRQESGLMYLIIIMKGIVLLLASFFIGMFMVSIITVILLISLIYKMFTKQSLDVSAYGDNRNRAFSIRDEVLKSIRRSGQKMSKRDYDSLVDTVTALDNILVVASKDKAFHIYISDLFGGNLSTIGNSELDRGIASLVNNDAHMIKQRILRR